MFEPLFNFSLIHLFFHLFSKYLLHIYIWSVLFKLLDIVRRKKWPKQLCPLWSHIIFDREVSNECYNVAQKYIILVDFYILNLVHFE